MRRQEGSTGWVLANEALSHHEHWETSVLQAGDKTHTKTRWQNKPGFLTHPASYPNCLQRWGSWGNGINYTREKVFDLCSSILTKHLTFLSSLSSSLGRLFSGWLPVHCLPFCPEVNIPQCTPRNLQRHLHGNTQATSRILEQNRTNECIYFITVQGLQVQVATLR